MKQFYRCIPAVFAGFLFTSNAFSQEWTKGLKPGCTFQEVQHAFYEHYRNDETPSVYTTENKDNEDYLRFKRWEAFTKARLDSTGHFPSEQLWKEFQKSRNQKNNQPLITSSWSFVGPKTVPGGGGGMGRINTMEFQPGNLNTMWVGSANGGLWKTMDGGQTWSSNTDLLPSIGVADIAIDPTDTNIMYIATGDGFGYEAGGPFWGGTYTSGIMRSVDGGVTWSPTSFSYSQNQGNIVQRLMLIPSSPGILLAAARNGLFRSVDSGATWTLALNKHVYDIELNTSNDSIVYCAGGAFIYRSLDKGATWTTVGSGIGSGGRISLAVTPADSSVIYALEEGGGLYRSNDGGSSFLFMSNVPATLYGYYDCALAVSSQNATNVRVGGLDIQGSVDGGVNWFPVGLWYGWPGPNYVHADNHDLEFSPVSGNTIFACNDGGIFKSTDGGANWSDLSSGISISQYYRLGGYAGDTSLVYLGAQDNGVVRKTGNSFYNVYGADGMESVVDPTNSNHVLTSSQNGNLLLSMDGGGTFTTVSPTSNGAWTIPIIMDPVNPNNVWVGYDDVYQSIDGGNTFFPASSVLLGGNVIDVMAVYAADNNYIYAGNGGQLMFTTDGGLSWTDITAGLPLSQNVIITSIAMCDHDPMKAWVTLSGYSAGNKVFKTVNGGATWTNFSGTLPNIPADALVLQKNTNDILYIGTDFGVYYRNGTMNDWVAFNTGLPNVIVDELEINYNAGIIRAATYGRGLWQAPLLNPVSVQEPAPQLSFTVFPNPSKGTVHIGGNGKSIRSVRVSNVLGEEVYRMDTANCGTDISIDLSALKAGVYFVKVESSAGNFTSRIVLER